MLELAIGFGAVLALAAALLAVPVLVALRVEWTETPQTSWRIRWLYGIVDVSSGRTEGAGEGRREAGTAQPAAEHERRRDEPKEARRGKRAGGPARGPRIALAVLRSPGFLVRAGRFLLSLRRLLKVESLFVHSEFGFDDPADTGQVYGALSPLLAAATAAGLDLDCRPNFLQSCFDGAAGATLRIRPLAVMSTIAGFLFSVPVLRAGVVAWRSS
jgi:hypothetical protein